MEIRNSRWTTSEHLSIDAEIEHPDYGWIPSTLSPDDPLTAELFAQACGGDVAEPLASTHAVPTLTFAQMMIGLVEKGWITVAEGEGWLVGDLPAIVTSAIAQLPAGDRFRARARATRPALVKRDDPLVLPLAMAAGKTAADVDDFFITFSQI